MEQVEWTWCAWCDEPVEDATEVNGIPFHWICLKQRLDARRQEAREARGGRQKPATSDRRLRRVR
jgi:hypothetical protein